MYQRRCVAVRVDGSAAAAITASPTTAATASIAVTSRLADGIVVAAVAVVVIQTLLLLLLLVMEMQLGGRVAWQWRFNGSTELLLLLLDLLSIVLQVWMLLQWLLLLQLLGGHGQQPLPVGANDLPLVLRILVRRSSHIAVAQSRWRWRMGRTMATVTLILNLGEEEILLVAVLVRFAGT